MTNAKRNVAPRLATTIDLTVVIPAYNEEHRLGSTVAELFTFLEARGGRFEILVVDDGSTDGTVALCRALAARCPELQVIPTAPNRGKGHAVRIGMLAARGALVMMCDADGSTPAVEIPRLLQPILDGRAAVAIGSRYLPGAAPPDQPLWRRLWSRLGNLFIQRTLVPGVRDTQCGFKAFTAPVAKDLFSRATIDGWAFDLEVLALARRLGHCVVEVGVAWKDDRRSRVRPWRDLWRVIGEAAAIKRNLARGAYGLSMAGQGASYAPRSAAPT
ncbi:MAG TPA: dolichyl-phosphate beta-glucosyltransferase [Polyangia bacterium]|nr:dolichyl-phosphate beta-glucosyltransferase [Polyangia bacterium]